MEKKMPFKIATEDTEIDNLGFGLNELSEALNVPDAEFFQLKSDGNELSLILYDKDKNLIKVQKIKE